MSMSICARAVPVMLWCTCACTCLLVVLLLEAPASIHSAPVHLHTHTGAPEVNSDNDFHFEGEPDSQSQSQSVVLKEKVSQGGNRLSRNYFDSNSKFSQWPSPLGTPVRILGLGLLLGVIVTYSLFCCVKKRSGSYGERSVPTLKIYRLKGEKDGSSEIPEAETNASAGLGAAQLQAPGYSPTPTAGVDQPKLIRIHESTIKTDPLCKVMLKDDISPPIRTDSSTTTPGTAAGRMTTTSSTSKSKYSQFSLPFSNPDPTKEPLKPFTYSPIPPTRPVRSKSNANASAAGAKNGKPVDRSNSAAKESGSGLPFSNPDPLKEPLKPFTYSPIPVKPDQD